MKIYDVSMSLSSDMITWPTDPKVKRTLKKRIPQDMYNVSELQMGVHSGTHVDTLFHISKNGKGADKLPLNSFYGKCKVLNLTNCKKKVTKADLKKHSIDKNDIILLKTKNSLKPRKKFNKNFIYVDEDAALYLSKKKIKTLGVDYLSVQKFRGGDKIVHGIVIRNMTLFEGLDLNKIKPGNYTFLGLPLKIVGSDGAPARVLLVK